MKWCYRWWNGWSDLMPSKLHSIHPFNPQTTCHHLAKDEPPRTHWYKTRDSVPVVNINDVIRTFVDTLCMKSNATRVGRHDDWTIMCWYSHVLALQFCLEWPVQINVDIFRVTQEVNTLAGKMDGGRIVAMVDFWLAALYLIGIGLTYDFTNRQRLTLLSMSRSRNRHFVRHEGNEQNYSNNKRRASENNKVFCDAAAMSLNAVRPWDISLSFELWTLEQEREDRIEKE